jgi:hypothetical protein
MLRAKYNAALFQICLRIGKNIYRLTTKLSGGQTA